MIAQALRRQVLARGLSVGTQPENLAALRLHQWGHGDFRQQHKVGKYRLDFAWPTLMVALEVDGPHHMRPDVAARDAFRDNLLRDLGWVVLRVNAGETLEAHLADASRIVHLTRDAS